MLNYPGHRFKTLRSHNSFELLEPRRLLASIAWDGGPTKDGTNLLDPVNWAGDVLPGPADHVTIQAVGTPTLTLNGDLTVLSLLATDRVRIDAGTLHVLTTGNMQSGGGITLNGGTLRGGTWQGSGLVATVNVNNRLVDAKFPPATFNGGSLIIGGTTTFTSMIARNMFTLGATPGAKIQFPISVQTGGMFIEMADEDGTFSLHSSNLTIQNGSTLTIGSNESHAHKMLLDFSSEMSFGQQGGTLKILADRFVNRSTIVLPSIGSLLIESPRVENFGAMYANAGTMAANGGWWVNHGLVAGGEKYVNILTSTFENKGTLQGGKLTLTVTGMHGNAGELLFETPKTRLALAGVFELAGPDSITVFGSLVLDGKYTLASDLIIDPYASLELMGQPELLGTIEAYGRLIITGSVTLSDLHRVHPFHRVDLAGNLDLEGGTLTIGELAGDWNYGGTIRNGVIDARAQVLEAFTVHLMLKNVQVYGEVIASADISLAGTTQVEKITLVFAHLGLDPGMTLHGTIVVASGSDPAWPYVRIGTNTLGGFTIGEDCEIILESGFEGTVTFGWAFNNKTTSVVNRGTIRVEGGQLHGGLIDRNEGMIEVVSGGFAARVMENTGTISALHTGASIGLGGETDKNAINHGSIHVGTGASAYITTGFINEGTFTFDGVLSLIGGGVTIIDLGEYSRGPNGSIRLEGLWQLEGATLWADLRTGSIVLDAYFTDGVLEAVEGSHFIPATAFLNNVEVRDTLVLTTAGSRVTLSGSTRFESLHLRGGSQVRIYAPYVLKDDIYLEPTDTDAAPFYRIVLDGFGKPVTIDEGAEIIGTSGFTGKVEIAGEYSDARTHLFNKGVIRMEGAGTSLYVLSQELHNEGLIETLNGGTLQVRSLKWRSNTGWIRSEGGTLNVMGSGTTEALGFDRIEVINGVGELSMALDNAGDVLRIDESKSMWQMRSSWITGGVIEIAEGHSLVVGRSNHTMTTVSFRASSVEVRGEILMPNRHTDITFDGSTTAHAVRMIADGTAIEVPAGTLTTDIFIEGNGPSNRRIFVRGSESQRVLDIAPGVVMKFGDNLGSMVEIRPKSYLVEILNRGTIVVGDGVTVDIEHQQMKVVNAGTVTMGVQSSIRSRADIVQTDAGVLDVTWGLGSLTPPVLSSISQILLAGTVVVAFDLDAPPIAPERFILATAANVVVDLTSLVIPTPPAFRELDAILTSSEFGWSFTSIADFDQNGFVDLDDYIAFQDRFEAGDLDADFNGDGTVDASDMTLFLYAFDQG
jgi:hypothetical protein